MYIALIDFNWFLVLWWINWEKKVYNAKKCLAHYVVSFVMHSRYHFKIYKISTIKSNNLYIIIKAEYLKFLYNRFKNELLFIKDRIAKYYNIKRMKRLSFEKGNKVYLLYKNIIIKQSNNKLDFKKFGLFTVI